MRNTTVTYNGEQMSLYDATQLQRKLERNIRENKKQIASYKGYLKETDNEDIRSSLKEENAKLRANNAKLNTFLAETGLKESDGRLRI